MSKLSKAAQAEKDQAITQLREWIKPGDTVYTILDHVSSSGMSRAIRVLVPTTTGATVDFIHPNWAVGRALGLRHWKRNRNEQDALVLGGCGMDMGFHLVYELSHALYGGGYECLGKGKCPSNYHVNHHDTIQCEGTMAYNPDGPNTGERCHWLRGVGWVISCDETDPDVSSTDDRGYVKLCPTCKGEGRIANPAGPERFDLVHTDGYALRHRWL